MKVCDTGGMWQSTSVPRFSWLVSFSIPNLHSILAVLVELCHDMWAVFTHCTLHMITELEYLSLKGHWIAMILN